MSQIVSAVTVGNVDRDDKHPQPSGVETIGVHYIPGGENSTLRGALDDVESQVIQRALQSTGWNRKRAAALLKISYRGLLYKIRRHSITPIASR
jgi:DNA-binding NtrC family response regulator